MKRIIYYFLQGVLIIAPVAVTAYVIYLIFNFADGLLVDQLTKLIGFRIPGLGLLLIVIFLTFLGFIAHTIIAKPFSYLYQKLLKRVPMLKTIYSSINDLFSAFIGKEKKFNVPVLVLINKENELWKLGFMTQKTMEEFGLKEMVPIYFPHSYNFSGELYIVPATSVKKVDLPPAEVMKFIVSGGVTRVL
ncbi:MAG TPA: DUF502 domain-containing protein [Prolixibacteraceae bacterium]|nr:DUF502 domain-containing protein [Prolixibacteraceae bacterium]HPS13815.1 DUF502 domain-containing protein [Prolixibacteraceae bacterium]